MRASRSVWRRRARVLGGIAGPVLLSLTPHAPAGEPIRTMPAPVAAQAPIVSPAQAFDLQGARQAAVERQPAVAAARDGLAAKSLQAEALDRIRLGALIARDLPVRKQQAALGLTIAQAALEAAECDARHAATYTYLAALYAQEQIRAADAARDRLGDLKTLAQTALEKGRKDVTREQVDQVDSFILIVEGRRQEATQGYERALAALREAIGLGPDCPIAVVGTELPNVHTKADRETIVQMAVSRRGEVVEAETAVGVYCLEVDAQGKILLSPARTFATGGDIHAQVLPAAQHDPDYRPGPVAPEMPGTLVGTRRERQDAAEAYHARAGAVAEKARNLVALEAEDAYLRWKQYDEEEPRLDKAAAQLEVYGASLSQRFDPEKAGYPTIDELINAGLKASAIRADANQTRFRRLAALANLERITAGGFDAGLDALPAPPAPPAKAKR